MTFAFLASIVLFAAILLWHVQHSRAGERLLQRSFDSQVFQTGEGELDAAAIAVVKRVTYDASHESGHAPRSAFWYCVGPGPRYFIAIAEYMRAGWRGGQYQWVIRPIDEDRMRHALVADEEALHAAFGDHVEGTLRA